jgi:hypothetical protein
MLMVDAEKWAALAGISGIVAAVAALATVALTAWVLSVVRRTLAGARRTDRERQQIFRLEHIQRLSELVDRLYLRAGGVRAKTADGRAKYELARQQLRVGLSTWTLVTGDLLHRTEVLLDIDVDVPNQARYEADFNLAYVELSQVPADVAERQPPPPERTRVGAWYGKRGWVLWVGGIFYFLTIILVAHWS